MIVLDKAVYCRTVSSNGGFFHNFLENSLTVDVYRWYERQVGSNQYGLGGRNEHNWTTESLEGVLTAEELKVNRADQAEDTARWRFRDEDYYLSKDFNLADIEIPVLSVANWVIGPSLVYDISR